MEILYENEVQQYKLQKYKQPNFTITNASDTWLINSMRNEIYSQIYLLIH